MLSSHLIILISTLLLTGSSLAQQDPKQADLAREEAEDYYRKWLQEDAVYLISALSIRLPVPPGS